MENTREVTLGGRAGGLLGGVGECCVNLSVLSGAKEWKIGQFAKEERKGREREREGRYSRIYRSAVNHCELAVFPMVCGVNSRLRQEDEKVTQN